VTELALRAPTLDDVPKLTSFFGAITAEHRFGGATEGDIRDWLTDPHLDPASDFRIALQNGDVVGWVDLWDQNRTHERLFVDARAHPRDRRIYSTLLDWAEERAAVVADGHPAIMRVSVASDNELLAAEAGGRGFDIVRHFFILEIDLADEPPVPEWPEEIAVRTYREGDDRTVYDADDEAFRDHWDYVPISFEEWRQFFVASSSFDPTLWFLAEQGDELVGFAICRGERRPGTAHVHVLGVRRAWRRRGIAQALLLHAFREFRRRGSARADLGVDAESLTGAVRLYERVGMHVALRTDTYEMKLNQ
jgi:mycothiol synthase